MLLGRIANKVRPQNGLASRIQRTTNGFVFCQRAVEDAFGSELVFAQRVKLYGEYGQHGHERYYPSPMVETISKVREG
jgi:hypothetical protein